MRRHWPASTRSFSLPRLMGWPASSIKRVAVIIASAQRARAKVGYFRSANSSPPNRTTVSVSRRHARIRAANALQHKIAGAVPMAVIDRLEVVQIQRQHREGLAGPACHQHGVTQPVGEHGPVAKAGQRIGKRQQVQLRLDPKPVRDILREDRQQGCAVAHHRLEPQFEFEGLGFAAERRRDTQRRRSAFRSQCSANPVPMRCSNRSRIDTSAKAARAVEQPAERGIDEQQAVVIGQCQRDQIAADQQSGQCLGTRAGEAAIEFAGCMTPFRTRLPLSGSETGSERRRSSHRTGVLPFG